MVSFNFFSDADHAKLYGIYSRGPGDDYYSDIRALVESATDSNVFTDADLSLIHILHSRPTLNNRSTYYTYK